MPQSIAIRIDQLAHYKTVILTAEDSLENNYKLLWQAFQEIILSQHDHELSKETQEILTKGGDLSQGGNYDFSRGTLPFQILVNEDVILTVNQNFQDEMQQQELEEAIILAIEKKLKNTIISSQKLLKVIALFFHQGSFPGNILFGCSTFSVCGASFNFTDHSPQANTRVKRILKIETNEDYREITALQMSYETESRVLQKYLNFSTNPNQFYKRNENLDGYHIQIPNSMIIRSEMRLEVDSTNQFHPCQKTPLFYIESSIPIRARRSTDTDLRKDQKDLLEPFIGSLQRFLKSSETEIKIPFAHTFLDCLQSRLPLNESSLLSNGSILLTMQNEPIDTTQLGDLKPTLADNLTEDEYDFLKTLNQACKTLYQSEALDDSLTLIAKTISTFTSENWLKAKKSQDQIRYFHLLSIACGISNEVNSDLKKTVINKNSDFLLAILKQPSRFQRFKAWIRREQLASELLDPKALSQLVSMSDSFNPQHAQALLSHPLLLTKLKSADLITLCLKASAPLQKEISINKKMFAELLFKQNAHTDPLFKTLAIERPQLFNSLIKVHPKLLTTFKNNDYESLWNAPIRYLNNLRKEFGQKVSSTSPKHHFDATVENHPIRLTDDGKKTLINILKQHPSYRGLWWTALLIEELQKNPQPPQMPVHLKSANFPDRDKSITQKKTVVANAFSSNPHGIFNQAPGALSEKSELDSFESTFTP